MRAALPLVRARTLAARGFAHAFSTRAGGVSRGPYASLNLGAAVGDDPAHVHENHRRLADAVGYDVERLHQCSQVHGGAAHAPALGASPADTLRVEADALVAQTPGTAVAIRVADCVPVLLADPATGHVAAAHAGWRGVVRGVVGAAIDALGSGDPGSLVAAIGPSIGPCCFEVGDDVAAEIAAATDAAVLRPRAGERPRVDLWRAVETQLRARGVRAVETLGRCTACDAADFYSFRRDGGRSGRMVGVIVAKDPPAEHPDALARPWRKPALPPRAAPQPPHGTVRALSPRDVRWYLPDSSSSRCVRARPATRGMKPLRSTARSTAPRSRSTAPRRTPTSARRSRNSFASSAWSGAAAWGSCTRARTRTSADGSR